MTRQHRPMRFAPAAARALALAVGSLAPAPLVALSFEFGEDTRLDFDTSLFYTAQWRLEKPSTYRLSPDVSGQRLPQEAAALFEAANNDDGNRNFDRGLTSNKLTAVIDLDLSWRNLGVFLRGRAYYDTVYADRSTDMDAVGYQTYNSGDALCCAIPPVIPRPSSIDGGTALGDFPADTVALHGRKAELLDAFVYGTFNLPGSRLFEFRVGSQVINWGETTIAPGINGLQNRIDTIAGNTAGAELREIFLPTGAVYGQLDVLSNLTAEAYYQYQWIETRLNGVGSYFGGTYTPDFVGEGSRNLLISSGAYNPDGSINIAAVASRTGDIEPTDRGQWGAALHYLTDGGTDFGLYAVTGHDRNPSVLLNEPVLSESGVSDPKQLIAYFLNQFSEELVPGSYTVRYFDYIRSYAASFTSVWGRANVQGELTYLANTPIYDASGTPERTPVTKFNFGTTFVVTPTALWDDLTLLAEVAGLRAIGKSNDELRYDASAWGYFLRAQAAYNNVLQGLDLAVPIIFQHSARGNFRGASAFYVENAKVASIGLQGTYLNKFIASVIYTNYFDGGRDNLLADRDNIALNLKYSF